jgi:hypothetical protein
LGVFVNGASSVQNSTGSPIIGSWPLNEGTGSLLNDVAGGNHGGFRSRDGGPLPAWVENNGQSELVFPGGDNGGYVMVPGGGGILTGPFFRISIEIKPSNMDRSVHLLNTKAASGKGGGFFLILGKDGKKIGFDMSDGNGKYHVVTTLPTVIEKDVWTKLGVEYNGVDLLLSVGDSTVATYHIPGFQAGPSRRDLHIGSYSQGRKSFSGSIRNVEFSIPNPPTGLDELILASDLGQPTIDGKLDDLSWQNAVFHKNFSSSSGSEAVRKTEFALSAGVESLYIAVRCSVPSISDIKKTEVLRDGEVFQDESFEIFVDPDFSGDHFFHLGLNAANTQFDEIVTHYGIFQSKSFDMQWNSAVEIGVNGWTAELAIPYRELLVQSDSNWYKHSGHWNINVIRNHATLSGSSPIQSSWGERRDGGSDSGRWNTKGGAIFAKLRTATRLPGPQYSTAERKKVNARRSRFKLNVKPSGFAPDMKKIRAFMYIPNNLNVPNWFQSMTPGEDTLYFNARHVIDVPEGVQVLAAGRIKGLARGNGVEYLMTNEGQVQRDGLTYTRYILYPLKMMERWRSIGPIYFRSTLPSGTQSKLYYRSVWDGGEQEFESVDLVTKEFPTAGRPSKLIEALAWMHATESSVWPDFTDSYGSLGFNTVSAAGSNLSGVEEVIVPHIEDSRSKGFKIMWVDGGFSAHRMPDARSLIPETGEPYDEPDVCPAYKGVQYQAVIDLIVEHARPFKPDILNLDIESFGAGAFKGKSGQCKRCTDHFEATGKEPADALSDLGTQTMVDIQNRLGEMAAATGIPRPRLGTYHTYPGGFAYGDVFDCDKLFQAGIDFCHPVFYGYGPENLGIRTRQYRKITPPGGRIIPWVTPGGSLSVIQAGKRPPEVNYDFVIEGYGSGVSGIYWFSFAMFKGIDFYYHGKAMEAINPISADLYDSVPVEGVSSNRPEVSSTALRTPTGTVILLSDYTSESPGGPITVTLPEAPSEKVWELASKKIAGGIVGNSVVIQDWRPGVEGANTALYYVGSLDPNERAGVSIAGLRVGSAVEGR